MGVRVKRGRPGAAASPAGHSQAAGEAALAAMAAAAEERRKLLLPLLVRVQLPAGGKPGDKLDIKHEGRTGTLTFPIGGVPGQIVGYELPPLIETKVEQGIGVKAEQEGTPRGCRLARRL